MEIPLDEIWAYQMPGTTPLTDGIATRVPPPENLEVGRVRKLLSGDPEGVPKKGFSLTANGREKFVESFRKNIEGGSVIRGNFTTDEPIYLTFFVRQSGSYCHIKKVSRSGKTWLIQYDFVGHDSKELSSHFAIVPVGNLSAGDYQVQIEPLAGDQAQHTELVCSSYNFTVQD